MKIIMFENELELRKNKLKITNSYSLISYSIEFQL